MKPIKNEIMQLTSKIGKDKKRVFKRQYNVFQHCSIEMSSNKLNIFPDHQDPERLKNNKLSIILSCENCRRIKYSFVEIELNNGSYILPDEYIDYEFFIVWVNNKEIIVERNKIQNYTKIGKKVINYIKDCHFDFSNIEKLQKQVETLLLLG
jgi:hypothetical protein